MLTKLICGALAAAVLAGCATKAEDIASSYVSTVQYQNFSCNQLGTEANRVSARVGELTGVQNKKASNDAVATGVALVLFWPAAFMISGDKQTASELGRLKGEMDALERASIEKRCKIEFRKA